MTTLTEGTSSGEFLLGEDAADFISRDTVTVTGGSYVAGQVLGKILASAIDAWVTATAYSIGDLVKPTVANGHYYRCKAAGTSGAVQPTWPTDGTDVADGEGNLVWTDKGTVNRYTAHDPDALDGSQDAVAILLDAVDASTADQQAVIIDRLAEVNGNLLTWKDQISAPNKTAGIASLLTNHIVVRS
jgi:hypothetical protein